MFSDLAPCRDREPKEHGQIAYDIPSPATTSLVAHMHTKMLEVCAAGIASRSISSEDSTWRQISFGPMRRSKDLETPKDADAGRCGWGPATIALVLGSRVDQARLHRLCCYSTYVLDRTQIASHPALAKNGHRSSPVFMANMGAQPNAMFPQLCVGDVL